jgi:hypothetical protein
MTFAAITYASPSAFTSSRDRSDLAMAANALRPVAFHGRVVEHGFPLRIALRALGQAIWSEDQWDSSIDFTMRTLDPVITVHPDRLWFEAFTQDLGAYVSLRVDPEVFAPEGDVRYGTTNIDFTAWLWGALGEMRSSRSTHFRVGAEGFEVATQLAGGRFEEKVELPDAWVRGFLQVQSAMALPGTRLRLRPVDLLAAIRFLEHHKAKVSPRALRYEMQPGEDAALVIEPWDHRVPLVGASHGYTGPRTIRTWGRRKLKLVASLLPFAEHVDVYLKGRALPTFYAVRLPGMTFLLGATGMGGGSGFDGNAGLDLMAGGARSTPEVRPAAGPPQGGTAPSGGSEPREAGSVGAQSRVLAGLEQAFHATTEALATATGLPLADAASALSALNRGGRVMFDVETREWRHRELFAPPLDVERLYPPDPRQEAAAALLAQPGEVQVDEALDETQVRQRRYRNPSTGEPVVRDTSYHQWRVRGRCGGHATELVVNDEERIIFGTCGCAWFKEHLLNQGPCEHMLALFEASGEARRAG